MTDDYDTKAPNGSDGDTDHDTGINLRPGLVVTAVGFVAALAISIYGWVGTEAGEQVPTSFGLDGQPQDHGSRLVAFGAPPLLLLGLGLLFCLLPRIDPRRVHLAQSARAYVAVWMAVVGFVVLVDAFSVHAAVSSSEPRLDNRTVIALCGMLFIIIGNYLPKTASNWFFGIRTPWTLSDDQVWASTHRLGGPMFMVLGGLVIVAAALNATVATVTLMAGLTVVVVTTVGFSCWKYRQVTLVGERPRSPR